MVRTANLEITAAMAQRLDRAQYGNISMPELRAINRQPGGVIHQIKLYRTELVNLINSCGCDASGIESIYRLYVIAGQLS